jgi:hypothetical protein
VIGLEDPLPRHVDPIFMTTKAGWLDGYARNSRGLHVPISTPTVREQCLAPSWRAFCAAVDFDTLDHPRDVTAAVAA